METTERDSQENISKMAPIIDRAYQLGKEKKVDEAFETLQPYLQRDEVSANFYQTVGWTVYRYLKAHLSRLASEEVNTLTGYYLHISPHRPEMVHSFIMIQVLAYKKLHAHDFSFINFCKAWNLSCFRQEDYLPETSTTADGKTITFQSLAVKVATCLYKELKVERKSEQAQEFLPFFIDISNKCPDYAFTPLYIANLHAWCGETEKAITEFKQMLVDDQQWYVWKHLGDLLEPALRISCYCKAMTMMDKEEYLVDIHLSLASLLQKTDAPQAAYELKQYMETFQRNGWRPRADAYALEPALRGIALPTDAAAFYTAHVEAAEEFVFSDQTQGEFVYTGEVTNRKGKRRARLSCRQKHLVALIPVTPLLRKAQPGDIMQCRYHSNNRQVTLLTLHPTGRKVDLPNNRIGQQTSPNGNPAQERKIVEGTVRQNDNQPYAFVGDCFVPPHLLQTHRLTRGQHVKVEAVKREDGRWRAVKICS